MPLCHAAHGKLIFGFVITFCEMLANNSRIKLIYQSQQAAADTAGK
jgi:hypothetical protein